MGPNQDHEKPQRLGEELDLDRLQPWLQKQFHLVPLAEPLPLQRAAPPINHILHALRT